MRSDVMGLPFRALTTSKTGESSSFSLNLHLKFCPMIPYLD